MDQLVGDSTIQPRSGQSQGTGCAGGCYTHCLSVYSAPAEYMSNRYVSEFERPLALSDLWRNFALLDFKVSPVTWTMRIELLGSLVMPLFARMLFRLGKVPELIALMLLFALVGATRSDFRFVALFVTSTLAALALAACTNRSVELPTIAAGKRLLRRPPV